MYAKALAPTNPPVALVIIATENFDALSRQLPSAGWGVADLSVDATVGNLRISPQGLRIEVEGQELLVDDANPTSPPGWWDAVSVHNERVMAVVAPIDSLDLNAETLFDDIGRLVKTNRVISGTLAVREKAFS